MAGYTHDTSAYPTLPPIRKAMLYTLNVYVSENALVMSTGMGKRIEQGRHHVHVLVNIESTAMRHRRSSEALACNAVRLTLLPCADYRAMVPTWRQRIPNLCTKCALATTFRVL
ncbi:hypothetical protein PUNSTDRAFT_56128, partial [Punctularia strigosozonata HHB-11173 SS5]